MLWKASNQFPHKPNFLDEQFWRFWKNFIYILFFFILLLWFFKNKFQLSFNVISINFSIYLQKVWTISCKVNGFFIHNKIRKFLYVNSYWACNKFLRFLKTLFSYLLSSKSRFLKIPMLVIHLLMRISFIQISPH